MKQCPWMGQDRSIHRKGCDQWEWAGPGHPVEAEVRVF